MHKPVDATSNSGSYYDAQKAVDSNFATAWIAVSGSFPQSIVVDLGRISSVTQLKNTFIDSTTWYYRIEGSNTNSTSPWNILVDRTSTGSTGYSVTENFTARYRYIRLTITGSASGNWASSKELQVYGTVYSQPTGIVPIPATVSSGNYLVGAQMCNLWGDKAQWDALRTPAQFAGRKPLMGWYDESYDVATDWQIKMAREHGIGFFFPCWFRGYNNAGKPVISQYDQFINSLANTAQYRDSIQWAIQWENSNTAANGTTACTGVSDFVNNVAPFWISSYFSKPNYLKIGNKPVVSIFSPDKFVTDCGGTDSANAAIAQLRTLCTNAGYSGVLLLTSVVTSTTATVAPGVNFDYIYSYHVPTFTGLMTTGSPDAAQVTGWQQTAWSNYNTYSGKSFITSASMGWDNAPWAGPGNNWQLDSTAYKTLLQDAKAKMDSMPAGSVQQRLLMLDNWNEYAEGHYICPTNWYQYGHLDAIREVFAGGGAHTHDSISLSAIPQLEPVASRNLALHQLTTTSSDSGPGYQGGQAVDATNEYTYWVAAGGGFPQWLQTDLGSSSGIGIVRTVFFTTDTWKYKIEGSLNHTTWTSLIDRTSSGVTAFVTTDTVTGSYRYIRITITNAASDWAAVKGFEVYGSGPVTLSAPPSGMLQNRSLALAGGPAGISVFPNPARSELYVTLENVPDVTVFAQLITSDGKPSYQGSLVNTGGSPVRLPVPAGLPSGTYFLVMSGAGWIKTIPVTLMK